MLGERQKVYLHQLQSFCDGQEKLGEGLQKTSFAGNTIDNYTQSCMVTINLRIAFSRVYSIIQSAGNVRLWIFDVTENTSPVPVTVRACYKRDACGIGQQGEAAAPHANSASHAPPARLRGLSLVSAYTGRS